MDEPWGYYAKWKKPDRKIQTLCCAIWINSLSTAKIVETESRMIVNSSSWGKERLTAQWIVLVSTDGKIKMDSGDYCKHRYGFYL